MVGSVKDDDLKNGGLKAGGLEAGSLKDGISENMRLENISFQNDNLKGWILEDTLIEKNFIENAHLKNMPPENIPPENNTAKRQYIGEMLVEKNLVTEKIMAQSLANQQQAGGQIGEILTHNGHLNNLQFYQTLAEQLDLPFINLLQCNIAPTMLHFEHISLYLQHNCVPFACENHEICFATTNPDVINYELLQKIGIAPDALPKIFITSPHDIRQYLARHFKQPMVNLASYGLYNSHPHYAIAPNKKAKLPYRILSIFVAILLWYSLGPQSCVNFCFGAVLLFYTLMLAFKTLLFVVGMLCRKQVMRISNQTPLINDDAALPIYTILVPLFQEEKAVSGIIAAISRLDYPAHKMDVKLILEEGDLQTLNAIKSNAPDNRFHIVVVPFALPQTKPRACNYALQFAQGEYLTIYDAEDAPNISQLRFAASIFAQQPNISCLQARLNYYNARENWLTTLFCIEYTMLFETLLPALYHLKIPIPLGGTSNHLRVKILRKLGGWDCFNVTEDADLGLRLASEGYVTLPIDACTMEEAPIHLGAWVKQRTRWIKGYMQTWRVMMKGNWLRLQQWRIFSFSGAHFFVGLSSINYVISALVCMIIILIYLKLIIIDLQLKWQNDMAMWILLIAACLHWVMAIMVMQTSKMRINMLYILLYPFYFALHSFAGFRALLQFVTAPYYWEKTAHNLSKINRFACD